MTAEFLAPFQNRIEVKLAQRLSTFDQPKALSDAMAYACLGGGKRLRARLVYASGTLFNLPAETLDPAAAAVEMVHAYSLIHDDLPAMDNDDFRRGKPTSHKVYGEGMAILAGDALLTQARKAMDDVEMPLGYGWSFGEGIQRGFGRFHHTGVDRRIG